MFVITRWTKTAKRGVWSCDCLLPTQYISWDEAQEAKLILIRDLESSLRGLVVFNIIMST